MQASHSCDQFGTRTACPPFAAPAIRIYEVDTCLDVAYCIADKLALCNIEKCLVSEFTVVPEPVCRSD